MKKALITGITGQDGSYLAAAAQQGLRGARHHSSLVNLALWRRKGLCPLGGTRFNSTEGQEIAELGLSEKVENYGPVSDHELAALYQRSIALVYPSLCGGFGIPPLEAMQCGTVVVASNRNCGLV